MGRDDNNEPLGLAATRPSQEVVSCEQYELARWRRAFVTLSAASKATTAQMSHHDFTPNSIHHQAPEREGSESRTI